MGLFFPCFSPSYYLGSCTTASVYCRLLLPWGWCMCLSSPDHIPLRTAIFCAAFDSLGIFFFSAHPFPSHHLISKCRANCSILSDIYWFDSLSSRLIPPALNHFTPGPGPSPGRSRRGEIMQADNASRQSITLMAFTMMPLRFLTNFRLLQLSICIAGKEKIWASGYLCFLSSGVRRFPFCLLFSSASEHNDETKSVASVQVTGLSASDAVCLHRCSHFDLFRSGLASFLVLCLNITRLLLQLPLNQLKQGSVVQAYLGSKEKAIWWLQCVATRATWDISLILDGSKRFFFFFYLQPPTSVKMWDLVVLQVLQLLSHPIYLISIHRTFAGCGRVHSVSIHQCLNLYSGCKWCPGRSKLPKECAIVVCCRSYDRLKNKIPQDYVYPLYLSINKIQFENNICKKKM